MRVRQACSVDEQPVITLVRWRLSKICEEGYKCRYLNGYCKENMTDRISSPIALFNEKGMVCVTMSGRIYRLEGPPGFEPDADFVLGIWSAGAPVIDVTAAFYDEVKQRRH